MPRSVPSVNVSPDAQSIPNSATMSPACASSMSSIVVGVHADETADLDPIAAARVDDHDRPCFSVPW